MSITTRTAGSTRRVVRSEGGATMVEFAILAPALFLLIMGTIELALMAAGQNILESATFQASRLGKTGFVSTGKTQSETVIGKLTGFSSYLLDASKITVTNLSYTSFDQIGQPEPWTDTNKNGVRDTGEAYTDINGNGKYDLDRGAAGFGNAGSIVVYTATYPWSIVTPIVAKLIATNGVVTLTARAVVKNEPYS